MKAKPVKINGQEFVRGWTRCMVCDKPIKYLLRTELALFYSLDGSSPLCQSCLDLQPGEVHTVWLP